MPRGGRARVPRIRSSSGDAVSGLVENIRRLQEAPQREREEARDEAEFQSQQRARGLTEALNMLSMGNKQGAADALTRLGIDVPMRDEVGTFELTRQPVPGEAPEVQGFDPRRPQPQEIALETPREKSEREGAAAEGRASRARRETFEFGQQGAEAAEERVRFRPPTSSDELGVSLFRKAATGEPRTPMEDQFLQDYIRAQRKDPDFVQEFRNRIVQKLSLGGVDTLSPHERDYYESNMRQRDPGAAPRAEARAEQGLALERARLGAAQKGQADTREFREETRESTERRRVFDGLDRARQTVQTQFERRRDTAALTTNRQQALAEIDAGMDAALAQLTERWKKRYPAYAVEIEAQYSGSTRPAQRPSILDLFNQGPTRESLP